MIRRRRRQAAPSARGRRRRHTLERLNRHLAVIAIAVEAHLGKSRPIVVLAALVLLAHLALVPLPAGVLHRALVAVHLEGFHDADARRPVPDDLVGHAAPNELIKVDAANDLPGLGVLVQLVRRRLLPRLRRLRCCPVEASAGATVGNAAASGVEEAAGVRAARGRQDLAGHRRRQARSGISSLGAACPTKSSGTGSRRSAW